MLDYIDEGLERRRKMPVKGLEYASSATAATDLLVEKHRRYLIDVPRLQLEELVNRLYKRHNGGSKSIKSSGKALPVGNIDLNSVDGKVRRFRLSRCGCHI